MEGRELFERIQAKGDNAFTEKEASKITRQICEALQCLHNKSIAHRDIKVISLLFHRFIVHLLYNITHNKIYIIYPPIRVFGNLFEYLVTYSSIW